MERIEWDEAREQLLEEGYLEIGDFRIELTLDNTFMDFEYIPRIAVYHHGRGRWYVVRNPIPKGERLDECWENAVRFLERVIKGEVTPDLGDDEVSKEFTEVLRGTML